MEIRQLRSVVAVARHASFTRAAEALSLAQPALSQHVAALERELGIRLFDRTNRRVALTDAGRVFSTRAERILGDIDAVAAEMAGHAEGLRGRVVLGTYQSFAEYTLPKLLGRFHARFPGIEVALREGFAPEHLSALREGKIDVFVGQLDEAGTYDTTEVRAEPLYEDELVLAASATHRLAARASVRIDDLRDERFVIFGPRSSSTFRLATLARAAGFEPKVAFESADSLTVRSLVAEGLGVALYPLLLGNTPGPRIALIPFAPERIIRSISLITRSSARAPSVRLFADFIRDALEHS